MSTVLLSATISSEETLKIVYDLIINKFTVIYREDLPKNLIEEYDYYITITESSKLFTIRMQHKGIVSYMEDVILMDCFIKTKKLLQERLLIAKSLKSKCKKYLECPLLSTERITTNNDEFYDVFSLIRERNDIKILIEFIKEQYKAENIDYVIGPETKGFLGFAISFAINAGFIPIRKEGKIPGQVLSHTYNVGDKLETIQICSDILPNSRVLIFDDLISSGTSMKACIDIVSLTDCVIVDCCSIIQVDKMKEEARQTIGRSYTVLLQ